jgi:pilus assembly protein CpaE
VGTQEEEADQADQEQADDPDERSAPADPRGDRWAHEGRAYADVTDVTAWRPPAAYGRDVESVARVVLALEAPDVTEEVMHFLDRTGHARVVATAIDDRQLEAAVRQLEPDAVVAQPSLVDPVAMRGQPLLAVDTRESVASLRAAIHAGARGFYVWPADRDALAGATAATVATPDEPDRRASVIAVHGARGGAGVTFVATHLASAFSRRSADCVLIDADPLYGDVASALGAPTEGVHTIADLLPLGEEVTADHLAEALWSHADGFRVLLPPPAEEARSVRSGDVRTALRTAATTADVVVVHLPRALDDATFGSLELADRLLEVLSLDVMCFRAASRVLDSLGSSALRERVGFVVNRMARGEVTAHDVDRVFGTAPLAVIPYDRSVAHAQDRGRLVSGRGRIGRGFDRLAARLVPAAAREGAAGP